MVKIATWSTSNGLEATQTIRETAASAAKIKALEVKKKKTNQDSSSIGESSSPLGSISVSLFNFAKERDLSKLGRDCGFKLFEGDRV